MCCRSSPDGKTVYTIVKTDAIAQIDAAADSYFYGIAEVPNLTDELSTKGLSVTNSVVSQRLFQERDTAKEFARFLTHDKADELYAMSNKMPVRLGVSYEKSEMSVLLDQYENSVEVPKLTDLSNYWIEMEIAFANIWKGNDVNRRSGFRNPKIMSQLQATE